MNKKRFNSMIMNGEYLMYISMYGVIQCRQTGEYVNEWTFA